MRQKVTFLLGAIAVAAAVCGTACNDPRYAERYERRAYNINNTVRIMAEREGSSPERAYFTVQVLENIENLCWEYRQSQLIGELAVRDFEYFDRRAQTNERNLERFFGGDPQRIRETLPRIAN